MPEEDPNPRTPDDDSLFQGKTWLSRKMIAFINGWTPRCEEVTHLISAEMDHPLRLLTRLKMRAHYLTCCYCERYEKNLRFLRSVIQSLPWEKDDASVGQLTPEAKERLKRALHDDHEHG
jgi:hypothetical protein